MITERQQLVLNELREIGRTNLFRYAESCPYLFQQDCRKVAAGDIPCAFGLGGLTYQVGRRLGWTTTAVLSAFKALEKRGLIIRETSHLTYKRPMYWWPAGLADSLCAELRQ